ncbi:UDP-N-acetylmuramoyl-L-alanyl-D-glutamate--2,6-diaminopimelate ligase [Eubacteriales bacterium OttesenSCG-928-N13]|nr:UDP-N-acetylmuramoyl-L-alanyl-D-glutamate--2,6-diaminopimelate ligase [Eubacteriales bacterium OttesenSCG-928-N13]
MKISDLARAVPGAIMILEPEHQNVTSLCTDSRKVKPGAMFFCIPGTRMDAHEFAPQAVELGAVALVVEHELDVECAQVIVPDVRAALSYIAAEFYGNPAASMHMIGLTGTKGKTTGSFLIKSILEAAGHKVGLIGTVCSMIGDKQIPANLTTPDPIDFQSLLRQMKDAGVTYVVMEVSAHATALRKLEGMKFDVCGFTNLSQDHLDFFATMENYLDAKMLLFAQDRCTRCVFNADDERVAEAIKPLTIQKMSTGIRAKADMFANDIEVGERGCSFRITMYRRYSINVELRLSGIFNVYNSLMAAAICDAAGVSPSAIQRGLEAVMNVPGRIELLDTETPYRVILDYAHAPDALENILTTVRETARARVIALFGCGGDRDHEKRPMMGEIGGRLSDYCILTSDNPRSEDPMLILGEIEKGIKQTKCEYIVIENRREAIRYALSIAQPGDVIVLAGKGHETYQEIKGEKRPFDEKVVVKQLLDEMDQTSHASEAQK